MTLKNMLWPQKSGQGLGPYGLMLQISVLNVHKIHHLSSALENAKHGTTQDLVRVCTHVAWFSPCLIPSSCVIANNHWRVGFFFFRWHGIHVGGRPPFSHSEYACYFAAVAKLLQYMALSNAGFFPVWAIYNTCAFSWPNLLDAKLVSCITFGYVLLWT